MQYLIWFNVTYVFHNTCYRLFRMHSVQCTENKYVSIFVWSSKYYVLSNVWFIQLKRALNRAILSLNWILLHIINQLNLIKNIISVNINHWIYMRFLHLKIPIIWSSCQLNFLREIIVWVWDDHLLESMLNRSSNTCEKQWRL